MKKLTLSILSLALVLILSTSAFSTQDNIPKQQKRTPSVTYLISVTAPAGFGSCSSYLVTISDIFGNYVAAPQLYYDGRANYVFEEEGPVTGGRVANLEKLHPLNNKVCSIQYYTPSDAIFYKFLNLTSYEFFLNPQLVPGDD
jgi:Phr family secreted Rap phosphatase inhibitor